MARPTEPVASILLDRERIMRLDFNALAVWEDQTKKNWSEIDTARLTAGDLRALLFALLLHEDASLTVEQVGALIHLGNLPYVIERITALTATAMPQNPGGIDAPDPLFAGSLVGMTSGPSGDLTFTLKTTNSGS